MRIHTDKKYSGKKVNAKRDSFPQFFLAIINIINALKGIILCKGNSNREH
jgi:hypothetical protein